jgi:hypothetical protein
MTKPSKEELFDLVVRQIKSSRTVAKIYDVKHVSVRRWLKEYGIKDKFFDLVYKDREKFFTKDFDEFMIGALLGDGCVEVSSKGNVGRFEMSHSAKQIEYFLWKKSLFGELITGYRKGFATIGGKTHAVCSLKSLSHPLFAEYRKLFYTLDGKKIISPSIKSRFTAKSLAVLIMDDGSHHKGDVMRISTDCFSYDDHLVLQEILMDNFGIKATISRGKNKKQELYHYMSFNKTNAIILSNIIRPYVIESMQYKLV